MSYEYISTTSNCEYEKCNKPVSRTMTIFKEEIQKYKLENYCQKHRSILILKNRLTEFYKNPPEEYLTKDINRKCPVCTYKLVPVIAKEIDNTIFYWNICYTCRRSLARGTKR